MPTMPALSLSARKITPVKSKITLAVLDVLAAAQAVAPRETSGSTDQNADTEHQAAGELTRVS